MKISEENLLAELKKKNTEALEYVMTTYGPAIFWLVQRILTDKGASQDVEECVSDVYVKAWEDIENYDPQKGRFKTWLLIIAKYKALDYRRKISGRQTMAEADFDLVADHNNSVEQTVLTKEQKAELIEAIKNLKDLDRQIFVKRYFLYESIDSIANCFGLTRQAVDNRLWRSRNLLKKLLQSDGGEVVV